MPKKVIFESFIHHLLSASRDLVDQEEDSAKRERMNAFLDSLEIVNLGSGQVRVSSPQLKQGTLTLSTKIGQYYTRGDAQRFVERQINENQLFHLDRTLDKNRVAFRNQAILLFEEAKI